MSFINQRQIMMYNARFIASLPVYKHAMQCQCVNLPRTVSKFNGCSLAGGQRNFFHCNPPFYDYHTDRNFENDLSFAFSLPL